MNMLKGTSDLQLDEDVLRFLIHRVICGCLLKTCEQADTSGL